MSYLYGLKKRGYTARMVDGQLKIRPKLTEKMRDQVQQHRDEILLELARAGDGPRTACHFCGAEVALVPYPGGEGWHWSECANCGESATYSKPYHLIASRLLGETIAVGSGWPRNLTGYTWAEIENLRGSSPQMVQAVHRVKKEFPGAEVVARDGIWWEMSQQHCLSAMEVV